MASMAYYHRLLEEDFSRRRQIFAGLMRVQTVLEAAEATGYRWRQHLQVVLPYLWLFAGTSRSKQLYQLLLNWIAHDLLPHRPDRLEPRAKKRRPKTYSLMNQPRSEMRQAILS